MFQNNTTSTIHSLTLQGLESFPVEIEVDITRGLPACILVGLPDATVSESRDRVRAAIQNSGFDFPRTRVTVNLAPADTKKGGSLFDLPIALAILHASGQIPDIPASLYCIGELALDGRIRPIQGALPLVHAAVKTYRKDIIIPSDNAHGVSLVASEKQYIYLASSLQAVVGHFQAKQSLPRLQVNAFPASSLRTSQNVGCDMSQIIGHHVAKRAGEIAAAGMHNLFFFGPPGAGKSMLARSIASILPPLSEQETIEATMIHSLLTSTADIVHSRPFRAPHHTASVASIVGGGIHLRPGEISLAHRGVLFFDETPEFRRDILEALRQPLEEGQITIHRMHGSVTYPARFLFIAAQNHCPCGFFDSDPTYTNRQCSCTQREIDAYQKKFSGPLLDRMDMKVFVRSISPQELTESQKKHGVAMESSEIIQHRVQIAHSIQKERQGKINGELSLKEIRSMCGEKITQHRLLLHAMQQQHITMRGYVKTLRVARTIADLAQQTVVQEEHLAEALNYTLVVTEP